MKAKTYHHGDLRTALIEKGIEVIGEKGAAALSLRKVAAACGVSEAAPYGHFTNKKALLEAIEEHVSDKFTAALKGSVIDTGETLEGLVCLGCAFVMFFANNPKYFDLIYNELDIKAGGSNKFAPYDFIHDFMFKLFNNINHPPELRERTFYTQIAWFQGLMLLTLIDSNKDPSIREKRVREALSTNYLLFGGTSS